MSDLVLYIFVLVLCGGASAQHTCGFFDIVKGVTWKLPTHCMFFHSRGYPVDTYELASKLGEAIASNPNLRVVDLGGSRMGAEVIDGLLTYLYDNLSVEELFLANNAIGPKGAKRIAELLASNHAIRHMDIAYNEILTEGALAIAEVLQHQCTLEWLVVEGNSIGDNGATVFAEAIEYSTCSPLGLKQLHVGGNMVEAKGAYSLARALQSDPPLEVLDLGYNAISNSGAMAIFNALRYNTNLRVLDLELNSIYGSNWHNVSNGGLMVLESLSLRENNISAESVVHFMEVNHRLRGIDIGMCSLDKIGVSHLADSLQHNYYIRHVRLDGNEVNDENAQQLVDAIVYRSCLNRPLEIISDYMHLNH
eukprot:CAMPEP_0185018916 /NCGR_PEP_ID=MMETSP1103-20130426/1586_1 /TAXON_ID=36769 /ORGANISM="Paraphysomonas bandaiensis, Strain Caron Lab Isolate" /LENGTH=363 /DNA_ID=CAMNT_0027548965 /DNA_START=109 /DNA_END=1197 /DNA_ORIENTATION=-